MQELYLLLSSEVANEMSLKGNISISLACNNSEEYCFDIHYKGETDEVQCDLFTHSHKMNVSSTSLNSFVQTLLREQQPVTTGCYDEVLIMQGEAISHMTGQPINVQLPLLCWVLEQL